MYKRQVPNPSVLSVLLLNIEFPLSFNFDIPTTLSIVFSKVSAIVLLFSSAFSTVCSFPVDNVLCVS